jgi:hypothetical protein
MARISSPQLTSPEHTLSLFSPHTYYFDTPSIPPHTTPQRIQLRMKNKLGKTTNPKIKGKPVHFIFLSHRIFKDGIYETRLAGKGNYSSNGKSLGYTHTYSSLIKILPPSLFPFKQKQQQ